MPEALVKDTSEQVILHNDAVNDPDQVVLPDDADEPEQEPDDGEEQDAEEEQDSRPAERFVPHQALHQERIRRQQAQQALEVERRAYAQKMGILQGRLDEINRWREQQSVQPVSQEPEPDINQDPAKWVQYNFQKRDQMISQLQNELAQTKDYFGQREQEFSSYVNQSTQDQSLKAAVRNDETEFAEQVPDYYDAIDYMTEMRHKELEALGNYDPRSRAVMIANEVKNLAAVAQRQGISPAEAAYNIAQARGFNGRAAQRQQAKPRLDTIRKGQQASRSLSSAPGTSPRGALTLDNLANMGHDEFAQLVPDYKTFKKLHMS